MAKYKRIYIGVGTGTLIALLILLGNLGLKTTADGNKRCSGTEESPCISYFNITNPTYTTVYIYNKEDFRLGFVPELRYYELYIKYYGKWIYTNFTNATRLPNIPKTAKYVMVFPRYSTKEFMLIGYKNNPADVVKWSLETEKGGIDPIWNTSWIIEDNSVYMDNAVALINITPHTCQSSPCNILFQAKQKTAQTQSVNISFISPVKLNNPNFKVLNKVSTTNTEYSYTCQTDYFGYNAQDKQAWCIDRQISNGTNIDTVLFNHSYLKGSIPTKTIWWNETEQTKQYEHVTDNFKVKKEDNNYIYYKDNVQFHPNIMREAILSFDIGSATAKYSVRICHESGCAELDPWFNTNLSNYCVVAYNFDNSNLTGNSINDLCGNYDGVIYGAKNISAGRFKEAFYFNGSSYVNTTMDKTFNSWTAMVWYNFTVNRSDTSFFISKDATAIRGWSIGFLSNADVVIESIGFDTTGNQSKPGWNHLTLSYYGDTTRVVGYYNGVQYMNISDTVGGVGNPVILGRRMYSVPNFLNDTLDEFAFFNRTLTLNEIQRIISNSIETELIGNDTQAPTYSNFQNNGSTTTKKNGIINFSIDVSDNSQLNLIIFRANVTGEWLFYNESITGTDKSRSYLNRTNQSIGSLVCANFSISDIYNNINNTNYTCTRLATLVFDINFCGNITAFQVFGKRNGTFQPQGQTNNTCIYNITNSGIANLTLQIKINQSIGQQYRSLIIDDLSLIEDWTVKQQLNSSTNNTCLFRSQNTTHNTMDLIYSFKSGCPTNNQVWINFTNSSDVLIVRNFTGYDKLFYTLIGSGARADNITLQIEDNDTTIWEGYSQSLRQRDRINVWHNITVSNWTVKQAGNIAGMDFERMKKIFFNIYYGGTDRYTFNDSDTFKTLYFEHYDENRTFNILIPNDTVYSAYLDIQGVNGSLRDRVVFIDDFESNLSNDNILKPSTWVNISNASSGCSGGSNNWVNFPCVIASNQMCSRIERRNNTQENGFMYLNISMSAPNSGTCIAFTWLYWTQDINQARIDEKNITIYLNSSLTDDVPVSSYTLIAIYLTANITTINNEDDGIQIYTETASGVHTKANRSINITINRVLKQSYVFVNGVLKTTTDISDLKNSTYLKLRLGTAATVASGSKQSVWYIYNINYTNRDTYPTNITLTIQTENRSDTIYRYINYQKFKATIDDFSDLLNIYKGRDVLFNLTATAGALNITNIRIDFNRSASLSIDEISMFNDTTQQITAYVLNYSNFSASKELTSSYQPIVNITSNQSMPLWFWLQYRNVTLGNIIKWSFDAIIN